MEMAQDPRDIPLMLADLPMRPWNALRKHGITTVGQIADMTVGQLKALRNMGSKSVAAVHEYLASLGLILTVPSEPETFRCGHPRTPGNTYTGSNRFRCKTCHRKKAAPAKAKWQRRNRVTGIEGAAAVTYDPSLLPMVRRAANLTQAQIATALAVKPDLVRQWEKGERTPTAPNILRYLIACNASPKDVCRRKDKPE